MEYVLIDAFSFSSLYRHYYACHKNKRGKINALKFELDAENQLYQLSLKLQNKSYNPSPASCFVLDKPKLREIIAADFRDRIVHYVVNHLNLSLNIYLAHTKHTRNLLIFRVSVIIMY